MLCIAVRGVEGSGCWRGWRSVEILGYHEDKVEILFLLYLENLANDGEPNWLEVLHPGNTTHELIDRPWPFPNHVDEPEPPKFKDGMPKNVLGSIYGKAFEKRGDSERLCHVAGLTAWDSWYVDPERAPVTIWPAEERIDTAEAMRKVFPLSQGDGFVPFTVFRLGPFRRKGLTLLAFKLRLSGETFEKLVEGDKVFTVDGPDTLLLRIKRNYIPDMPGRPEWFRQIAQFGQYIGVGESYDVILLSSRSCQEIVKVRECGIVEAPLQPQPRTLGVRYITANSRFCLSLASAKNVERNEVRQAVGLSSRA